MQRRPHDRDDKPAPRAPQRRGAAKSGTRRPLVRLAVLLVAFAALSALGIWWASPGRGALAAAWAQLGGMPRSTHLLLAALALALIGAEMLRLVVMGRALGTRVGFWAALDATVANNFFSWLTPGAALGEPAATYMLGRHGVPWDAAVLIAFGKFAISFALIFGLAFALVAAGMGPPIPPWLLLPIAWAVGAFALLLGALIVGAFWPERSAALASRLEGWLVARRPLSGPRAHRVIAAVARTARGALARLGRFRRAGLARWLAILASQLAYHAIFVGVLVVLAAASSSRSVLEIAPTAVIYQGFLYLAPTPGSSGLGEASAPLFFGGLLGPGAALAVVLSFRALTYWLHVALGLIYLPLAGGVREILSGKQATEPAALDQPAIAGEAQRQGEADADGDL